MNNGFVRPLYVYKNQAYARYNNGLYPVQTTSNIIANLRLQKVPNSEPLIFPNPLKISNINTTKFTNIVKRDGGGWFGLFGTKPMNISSYQATSLRALSNNMQKNVTPSQASFVIKSMPQSIQDGIQFLLQRNPLPAVIDLQDKTGLSQTNKDKFKKTIGDKSYNFIIEKWNKLDNKSKNLFKVVGTSVSSGFAFYAAEMLLNIGWVSITGIPPPPALGMILRSGRTIASGGL